MRPLIEQRFDAEKIPYEFLNTEKYFDTFKFAKEIDLDKYSVLIAAGGDGTYHEVINGMLAREDNKKIPIAVIPNGSGNDLCSSIGIWSLDHALDYIVSGECVALDTIRCLMDHETKETVPKDETRSDFIRHCDVDMGMGISGRINVGATPYKKCCGKKSYDIATIIEKCKGNFVAENFEVEIDGKKIEGYTDVQSLTIFVSNGKYTGGGMVINPFACMNDGLIDITWIDDPALQSLLGVAAMLDEAKSGAGIQAYRGTSVYMRGRKIKVSFKNRVGDPANKVHGE